MRIVKRALPRIVLVPETLDDLWHLEKVIEKGDLITSSSERRFTSEGGRVERKKVKVKIQLDAMEFHKTSNKLRFLGTIVEGHPEEYVTVGSHHTIEVMPGQMFTIDKTQWKKYQLDRLKEAVEASKRPQLVIAVMDDESTELALLREYGVEAKGTISSGKSGKQYESKAKSTYFDDVAQALSLPCDKILLAGPGFTKQDFMQYLQPKNPELVKKIITEDIGGAGRAGIQEVLKRDVIKKVMEKARVVQETELVEKLLAGISNGLATYGLKQVEEAIDFGAVEALLVSDELFSKQREKLEPLMAKAEQTRSEVHIVGTDHDAGKQLKSLSGIAALLRFKIE